MKDEKVFLGDFLRTFCKWVLFLKNFLKV
jgi:hypothetical protein